VAYLQAISSSSPAGFSSSSSSSSGATRRSRSFHDPHRTWTRAFGPLLVVNRDIIPPSTLQVRGSLSYGTLRPENHWCCVPLHYLLHPCIKIAVYVLNPSILLFSPSQPSHRSFTAWKSGGRRRSGKQGDEEANSADEVVDVTQLKLPPGTDTESKYELKDSLRRCYLLLVVLLLELLLPLLFLVLLGKAGMCTMLNQLASQGLAWGISTD